MYSNTESHYSVIESKNHKGLSGKVSDAVRYLWTYWQSSDGTNNVNAMHHTLHLCNWFSIDFAACKWNACTFAGSQVFVFDLQHHRIGLSWIEQSFKAHFSAVTLSIHCMIISECVCVYVSQFWLCVLFQWSLNNVSMQQRSEAIPDTSLPLTKHQQNFILSLSLSFSSSLPPSLPPVLFRWLAVFTWWSSLALGTGGRGIREMKLGEKRKTDSDLG